MKFASSKNRIGVISVRANWIRGFYPTSKNDRCSILVETFFSSDELSAALGEGGSRISAFKTVDMEFAKQIAEHIGAEFDGVNSLELGEKTVPVSALHGFEFGKVKMTAKNEWTVQAGFSTNIEANLYEGVVSGIRFSKDGIAGIQDGEDNYFVFEANTVTTMNSVLPTSIGALLDELAASISEDAERVTYGWDSLDDIEAFFQEEFEAELADVRETAEDKKWLKAEEPKAEAKAEAEPAKTATKNGKKK